MLWEAKDKTCKVVELAKEKILEISDGWYIDSVIYPDKTSGEDINSLTLTIKRDVKRDINEQDICKTCTHYSTGPSYYCEVCCRYWGDNYERR